MNTCYGQRAWKAGNLTRIGCNTDFDYIDFGYRLTKSVRNVIKSRAFENDQRAKTSRLLREAVALEESRIKAHVKEDRRQEREKPMEKPNFLRRAFQKLKTLARSK